MKRIVFATFGSLGDVHPYIALALELKRRGHQPVIATTDLRQDLIESVGLDFAPMRPSLAELGDPAEIVRKLFHPTKGPGYLIRDLVMPHVRDAYEDLDRACARADIIVTHPLTFAGRLVAEKRGLSWRSTVLSPLSLMSTVDPPLFPAAPLLLWVRKLGVAPYRALFNVVKRAVGGWEKPLHELRADLGLPPMTCVRPEPTVRAERRRQTTESKHERCYAQFEGQYAPEGNLALFSRVLAEPQADWPANTTLCGFSRYDGPPTEASLKTELDDWLAAGPPPIVFTLGSSVSMDAGDFFTKAIEAAQRVNHRALLITGQDPAQYDETLRSATMPAGTIKLFRYLPYSAVFPHAAVNVHQGGVGTLGQALAAGKPQLIVPVAFDQPDNARRTARLGVSRAISFQKVTVEAMTSALRELLASTTAAANAVAVARTIADEENAKRAAELLSVQERSVSVCEFRLPPVHSEQRRRHE